MSSAPPSSPAIALGIAAILVTGISLRAQDEAPGDILKDRARAMLREALTSEASFETLRELTQLAPHRLAGSPGADAAVAWATQKMKALGLTNVRGDEFPVPHWVRGTTCDVRVIEADGSLGPPLPSLALGGSVGTPATGIEAEVVVLRTFAELRSTPEVARGKIVLWNRPFDRSLINTGSAYGGAVNQRTQGASEAAKAGAVAVLVRSIASREDDVPHTGAMRYDAGVPEIPATAIGVLSAARLAARIDAGERIRVRITQDCATLPPARGENVIGEIRGRENPDEIVLIGAHLDGWDVGHGAHDDGAGVAHVFEACRLIIKSGAAPRCTIRAVLYANEENGLAGGKDYAVRYEKAMDRHRLAVETDSGGFAPRGFSFSGGPAVEAGLEATGRLLRSLDLGDLRPGSGGADISTLEPFGVPLLGLRTAPERYFDLHHTPLDVLSAVHPRELATGAAALAVLALSVAEAEGPYPRAIIPGK